MQKISLQKRKGKHPFKPGNASRLNPLSGLEQLVLSPLADGSPYNSEVRPILHALH